MTRLDSRSEPVDARARRVALSLRARLTAWYTLAVAVALVVFAGALLWEQQRIGLQRVDRDLESASATIGNILRDELREGDAPDLASREALALVSAPGLAVAVFDATGGELASAWNGLTLTPAMRSRLDGATGTRAGSEAGWRLRVERLVFEQATFAVLAGAPLAGLQLERNELLEAMMIGIPLAVMLAAIGGFWLASFGLTPISRMAERAAALPLSGTGTLGEDERSDELGQLARAFNGLVARLRAALQTHQRFMADASHELRTPVSVMRSAADVTLARGNRPEAEYREALAIVSAQGIRVTRLVDDMLLLARADAGGYQLQQSTFYLDEIVADCRRTLAAIAAGTRVSIGAAGATDVEMHGDEDLIRRLVLNVLQNAVQHAPADSRVDVEIASHTGAADIRIRDRGPGIPEADRGRIFDRFVQLDPSRRTQGAGLGLSIARWIAEIHHGSLTLESSGATGSVFLVHLPL